MQVNLTSTALPHLDDAHIDNGRYSSDGSFHRLDSKFVHAANFHSRNTRIDAMIFDGSKTFNGRRTKMCGVA